jgi:hypothetical protein
MTTKSSPPDNIRELNIIAGMIFAELYKAFPVAIPHLDRQAIADVFGAPAGTWNEFKLPSGRPPERSNGLNDRVARFAELHRAWRPTYRGKIDAHG